MHLITWYKYEASPLGRLMAWAAGIAVLVLAVSVSAWAFWLSQGGVAQSMWPFAVILSVVMSVLTLVTAIGALTINSQSERIRATIEAWAHLSDNVMGTTKADLRPLLGRGRITDEQARAMIFHDARGFRKPNGEMATQAEIAAAKARLSQILKDMERLGVGVNLGVYDAKAVYYLGRTRYISMYEYLEAYVECLRGSADRPRVVDQPGAYSEAEMLKSRLEAMGEKTRLRQINRKYIEIANTRAYSTR